jgi:transcriptional repressor NrdR
MNAIAGEAYDLVNNSYKHEITSNEIGELIMERLKTLDKVAYVRFASVYKDFTNPELFAEEVKKISDESGK